jgi:hypothetical protein
MVRHIRPGGVHARCGSVLTSRYGIAVSVSGHPLLRTHPQGYRLLAGRDKPIIDENRYVHLSKGALSLTSYAFPHRLHLGRRISDGVSLHLQGTSVRYNYDGT